MGKLLQMPRSGKTVLVEHIADLLFEEGVQAERRGDKLSAAELYSEAVITNPFHSEALVNLGTLFLEAHEYFGAETHYLAALKVRPDYSLAHYNIAMVYDHYGNISLAIHHYREALRFKPSYADAHYNLAIAYQQDRQPMQAIKHWKEYIKLDPSSSWGATAKREVANMIRELMPVPIRSQCEMVMERQDAANRK